MAQELLIGDYGLLTAPAIAAAEVSGNGTTALTEGAWVEVTALAAASSEFQNIVVGDLFYAGKSGIMPPTGDKWKPLTESIVGFIRSWQLEFARTSIDTTTLRDLQSTSIFGRPTLSGTLGGILVTGDPATGDADIDIALKRFVESYKFDFTSATTTRERVEIETDPIALIGYTLKKAANKPFVEAYYMPTMDFGNFTVGSEVGGLTEFSSPMSLGLDPLSRGIKRYEIALPTP